MSFSSDAKAEIVQKKISRACCARAACYGIACFARYFDSKGLVLQTELPGVAHYAQKMFQRCGVEGSILEKERASGILYEFAIKEPGEIHAMQAMLGSSCSGPSLQIDPALFICSGCVAAYVASAFLCSGTATDPQKEYTIEFLTPRSNLSRDFEALLAEHEFAPHRARRKGINIIYVKASEQVEDLLTFMGASSASMRLMDEKAYKSLRNQTNRRTNCDTANIKKTSTAYGSALRAIRFLQQENALAALPAPLQEAAEKRMAYPDASLAQLAERFEPPISKSGLSHRLKKIEDTAASLRARREGNTHA